MTANSTNIYTVKATDAAGCSISGTTKAVVGNCSAVLPIALESFTAQKVNSGEKLNWTTATEINSSGFYVEWSSDATIWNSLTFVKSLSDGGNSTTALNYTYTDATPHSNTIYYRLKQVDIDGKVSLSPVIIIQGSDRPSIAIYPNPAINNLNLTGVANGYTYRIVDMKGILLLNGIVNATPYNINIDKLISGVYFILIYDSNGNEVATQKFIKK